MTIKILMDMQCIQGESSRSRGIGRYTLELALTLSKWSSEIEPIFLFNNSLSLNTDFLQVLLKYYPSENIIHFNNINNVSWVSNQSSWRHAVASIIRSEVISKINPHIFHVNSVFEGHSEDYIVSRHDILTTATLYDIIPYIHPNNYLAEQSVFKWYMERIKLLKTIDRIFSISDATKNEAITQLQIPSNYIQCINSGISNIFTQTPISIDIYKKYPNLSPTFILYTGGIDERKNIERLLEALIHVSENIQLVIVCKISSERIQYYVNHLRSHKINAGRVIFTGFISDEELCSFYQKCKLFVFPSWHEGLGLPVIEAMACGAAVVAAKIPSMRELISDEYALFDPYSPTDIGKCIQNILNSSELIEALRVSGLHTAKRFTWERTGRKFVDGIKDLVEGQGQKRDVLANLSQSHPKKRLAVFSPWLSQSSGIADYAKRLVPELGAYYEVVAVGAGLPTHESLPMNGFSDDQFEALGFSVDRILYLIGDSLVHKSTLEMMIRYPGTVIAHDFYLSSVCGSLEYLELVPGYWTEGLYYSHGWAAVASRFREPYEVAVRDWPCNAHIFMHANGLIVHSRHALESAGKWFGHADPNWWALLPFPCQLLETDGHVPARVRLGLGSSSLVFASFGAIAATKMTTQLLEAWEQAGPLLGDTCQLLLVGENHAGEYGARVQSEVSRLNRRGIVVKLIGRATHEEYSDYLSAADVAVQLRTQSHGETSAAVFDCLRAGVPTIVNAHGSAAELPDDVVDFVPDQFSRDDLVRAIVALGREQSRRERLAGRSVEYVRSQHDMAKVAAQLHETIERFAATGPRAPRTRIVQRLIDEAGLPANPNDWAEVAHVISTNERQQLDLTRTLFLVVPGGKDIAVAQLSPYARDVLQSVLSQRLTGWRVEPVFSVDDNEYVTATKLMFDLIGTHASPIPSRTMSPSHADVVARMGFDVNAWDDILRLITQHTSK